HLSKARGRPDRHLSRYPRMRVTQFVKKCGASSRTRVGQWRLRSNTGSEAGNDNRYGRCPLWVKSRHMQCKTACPLLRPKATLNAFIRMSAIGQKQTSAEAERCHKVAYIFANPTSVSVNMSRVGLTSSQPLSSAYIRPASY